MSDQIRISDSGELEVQPRTWDGELLYSPATVQEGLFATEAFEQLAGQMSMQADDDPPARLTYREKRLRKAERLRGWAGKREDASAAAYERSREIADRIPFGQPILVGHHSERGHRADIARIDSAMSQAVENSAKASNMLSRAENIEAAAARAIYSDDPDAVERLRAKVAKLEAQRDRIKAENAAYRKAHGKELRGLTAFQRDAAMPHRGYVLTNLGATIRNARERLVKLEREVAEGPRDRIIVAKRSGTCETCGAALERGQTIRYNRQLGARCVECES